MTTANNVDLGELLNDLDIESWIDSQGLDYTTTRGRSGMQLNIHVCPVCGDANRKVYMNADTGLGNCFAGSHPAGETFNKWRFVRAVLADLSGRQIVEHLQSFTGRRTWVAKVERKVQDDPVQLVMPASIELPYQGRNIKYLSQRGITAEIAAYFRLRYCEAGFFPYMQEGVQKNMYFNNRVIIPVLDMDGNLCTFQGRDITGLAERKYLFPPGLAASGSQIFNGFNAKGARDIVVGEGAFDVAAVKIALDTDPALVGTVPVGTFGKHLSGGPGDSQEAKFLQLYESGTRNVTFMWDGEIRATDDAVRAGTELRKWGFNVRIAMLPKDKDPNEVLASVVLDAYRKAIPLTLSGAIEVMTRRRQMNQHA